MYTRLSKEIISDSKVLIDSEFFTSLMPFAPENYVKIYLYGYMLAYVGDEASNTPEEIARRLSVDVATVSEAFAYWSGMGAVNLLSTTPLSVEYLPVTKHTAALRKFSKTKYKDFNDQLHAMLPSRNILPSEYNDYYSIMEAMHIEPTAMLAVIAYCIRLKGESVASQYIMAVARNLAHQGCLTYERVSEQLSEFDLYDKDLLAVFKALGVKKSPAIEDKHLFKKWVKKLGFALETVIAVAKTIKKGGMEKLDSTLTKYYENRLLTLPEIEQFNANRDRLYALTYEINRRIGVYYEQVDFIIETYVTKWLGYGFDDQTLLNVADYCFKHNIRTLKALDETVEKFYKQGLVTEQSIAGFVDEAMRRDNEIRKVLETAGVTRSVNSRDRDSFRTWTYAWKMDESVILYAAQKAQGTPNPLAYMNTLLSTWNNAGITTIDAAKAFKSEPVEKKSESEVTKTYTSEQLNALFDRLNYEDL